MAHTEFAPHFGGSTALNEYMARAVEGLAAGRPGSELLVAKCDGNIVGTVTWFAAGADSESRNPTPAGWARLRNLAVHPARRHQGIGQLLVLECLNRSEACGGSGVCLGSWSVMKAAARLYTRMGFDRWPEFDWPHDVGKFEVHGYRKEVRHIDAS